ncbi:hypothetical protein A0H81_04556 [Grifola frondosa]|uniref:Uncharacterized protein n=1 Tax=Grifola frondosa TaxID=5627 RepID=A0A1C7MKT8_GRIFR|nr:hypothetical protein A0H81_04556 [Grifola frondosa]
MSAEYTETTLAQIRDLIARLQSPVPDLPTLQQLLAAPLGSIGLLQPRFRKYNVSPLDGFSIPRHMPPLQRALLEHIIPTWHLVLVQEDSYGLVEQYFCPDAMSFTSPAAGQVAVYAYSTILSLPLRDYSVRLLAKLCKAYPIDVLHSVVFSSHSKGASSGKNVVTWEDCVRNVVAVPAKVANATEGKRDIPPELEHGTYFNNVSVRCECLISSLSASRSRENISSITYLLAKLVNLGVFSPFRQSSRSQPSFFAASLPTIGARLSSSDSTSYSAIWSDILTSLPSSLALRSVLTSLFSSLTDIPIALDPTNHTRALVKREALLLRQLLGRLEKGRGEVSESFSAVALGREWSEGHARIFVCWAAGAEKDKTDEQALKILLSDVVDMWTNPDHVRHSLLSRHHYLTALLLLTLSSFRGTHINTAPVYDLALTPSFISAISTYISHLDASVRRCGMLVAEEVARGAGKNLDFGDWEGTSKVKLGVGN